jgi:sarcosine dehydrogenase
MGAPGRRHGRHQCAAAAGQAPVCHHRKIDGLSSDAPTIRDPDRRTYFKEEVGGLSFGGYEPNPQGWTTGDVPNDWEFQLFDDDYDHFEQHMIQAMKRVPALEKAGVKQMINGPESFTPGRQLHSRLRARMREHVRRRGLQRLRHCGGRRRRLGAGAMGRSTARRRSISGSSISGAFPRCIATGNGSMTGRLKPMASTMTIGFPHEEYESGRPRIVSPLYERLKSHRAVFGSKLGWERPNWFAPDGMEPCDIPSMGRQNWFDAVGEEHRHVREKVGIFDQSSFAKYEVSGADALAALSNICANDVTKPVGRLTYTQLLNTRGGIEADLTVARLAEDRFYIVTGTGFRTHDLAWIREHMPEGADVRIEDITEDLRHACR